MVELEQISDIRNIHLKFTIQIQIWNCLGKWLNISNIFCMLKIIIWFLKMFSRKLQYLAALAVRYTVSNTSLMMSQSVKYNIRISDSKFTNHFSPTP